MKKLLIAFVTLTLGLTLCSAAEFTRETLMVELKAAQTPESAGEIFANYVKNAPDLEFAHEIYRMWSANEGANAQACMDTMRADAQYAGRLTYFEGADIENVIEKIDYCRKLIEKTPDAFEPYALMFDTYTNYLFKEALDDSGNQGGEKLSPEMLAELQKNLSQDNEKMVRVRNWKEKGEHTELALKYMSYYGFFKKHYDDALKYFQEGEALKAGWVDFSHVAVAAVRMKKIDLAREYVTKYTDQWISRGAVQENRRKEMTDSVIMFALVNGGAYDEAIAEIQSREGALENSGALYDMGCLYSRKGDIDKAFETLEQAVSKGFNDATLMETDADLTPLHADSRWSNLKKGVKTAWDKGEGERIQEAVAQKIEKDAPAWELSDPAGNKYKLSDYAGKKVVILDFWATWCGPCMMAMPKLHEWTQKNKPDQVEIFSINTWERQPDNAKKLFVDKKYSMILLMNGDETGKAYGLQGIPYICVIDKNGKIRYEMKGFSPELEQNLTYWVQDLLK